MDTHMSEHIESYMDIVKAQGQLHLAELRYAQVNDQHPLDESRTTEVMRVFRAMDELLVEWTNNTDKAPRKGEYAVFNKLGLALRKLVKSFWLLNSVSNDEE